LLPLTRGILFSSAFGFVALVLPCSADELDSRMAPFDLDISKG